MTVEPGKHATVKLNIRRPWGGVPTDGWRWISHFVRRPQHNPHTLDLPLVFGCRDKSPDISSGIGATNVAALKEAGGRCYLSRLFEHGGTIAMKKLPALALLALVLTTTIVVTQVAAQEADAPTLTLADNAEWGQYLTDSEGMSLYLYTLDEDGTSACVDACVNNWPPVLVPEG